MYIELPADDRYGSVDREMINSICEAHFSRPSVVRVVALEGGLYNTTFRLEFADGSPLVLRIAPAERDQRPSEWHFLRNEVASIPLLAVVADLMPSTLVADFSHEVVSRDYVVQSWLLGTAGAQVEDIWNSDDLAHLWRCIGEILHRIHSRTSTGFGRIIGPTYDTWPESVANTLLLMAEGCAALGLAADDLRMIASAAESDPVLATVHTAHLLHGDLGPGNVMVNAEDPTQGIIGIFDCDRISWGDPSADITFAYVERLGTEHRQAFWDGYGSLPEPTDPRRELYYLAQILGEARLQHARLGRTRQLRKTYDLLSAIAGQLAY